MNSSYVESVGSIIENHRLPYDYKKCISEFVDGLVSRGKDNIQAILIFGGCVRDGIIIEGWSDIDIALIYKERPKMNSQFLATYIENLEFEYHFRIDVTQLFLEEITGSEYSKYFMNGAIINAIKRKNIGIILYGNLPEITFSDEQEKQAALVYMSSTILSFREYLIEKLFRGEHGLKNHLPRLIRWTFSLIRSSLRLFDVYVHPYEDSINSLKRLFPSIDTKVLDELVAIRRNFSDYHLENNELILRIEDFVETYIPFVLLEYSKRVKRR